MINAHTVSTIPERQEQIDSFHNKLIASNAGSSNVTGNSRNADSSSSSDYMSIDLTLIPAFSEGERKARLDKAFASSFGDKIKALMDGDLSEYDSQSEADLALMGHLAFWFEKDAPTMDTIFRESGLYRTKYEREDYAKRTISRALHSTKSVYKPSLKNHEDKKGEYCPNPDRFRLMTVAEYLALSMPEYLIDKTLPQKGIAIVVGKSGAGKTFVVLDMVAAIASGEDWFERKTKKTSVVYIVAEGMLQNRIKALKNMYGKKFEEAIFYIVKDPFNLFSSSDDVQDIALKVPKGSMVVIDTLAQASPGMDENSGKDMGQVIQNCKMLQQEIDGLVLLVAHSGKGKAEDIRGHSSLRAAADAVIIVNKKSASERCWKVLKLKEGEDGKEESFKLEEVAVDFNGNTSCVVKSCSRPGSKWKPSKNDAIAKESLAAVLVGKNQVSNAEWQVNFCSQIMSQSPELKEESCKRSFRNAKKSLIENGVVVESSGMYRLLNSSTEET